MKRDFSLNPVHPLMDLGPMTRRSLAGVKAVGRGAGRFRGALPDLVARVREDYQLERGATVVDARAETEGPAVWVVADYPNGHRCLSCEFIETDGGGRWWLAGRSVCALEGDGPPLLTCPPALLDLVPDLPFDWSRGVRARHGGDPRRRQEPRR